MRLAPIPLVFADDPERAIELAGQMSCTTHGTPQPIDACRDYAGLILGALKGEEKETLLARYAPVDGLWRTQALCTAIDEIAAGSFKQKQPPEIRGIGYVV